MYFSAENLPGVNPVVMNYKIRHSKNQSAMRPGRISLAWADHFSHYYLWWQKNGKHGLVMRDYMQGYQTRSRLTEKLAKCGKMCMHHTIMATTEEKQIDTHPIMEQQMYYSKNILRINPGVMNYKIRHK